MFAGDNVKFMRKILHSLFLSTTFDISTEYRGTNPTNSNHITLLISYRSNASHTYTITNCASRFIYARFFIKYVWLICKIKTTKFVKTLGYRYFAIRRVVKEHF